MMRGEKWQARNLGEGYLALRGAVFLLARIAWCGVAEFKPQYLVASGAKDKDYLIIGNGRVTDRWSSDFERDRGGASLEFRNRRRLFIPLPLLTTPQRTTQYRTAVDGCSFSYPRQAVFASFQPAPA